MGEINKINAKGTTNLKDEFDVTKIKIGDVFPFDNRVSEIADYCNENGFLMKEVEEDEKGNRQYQICKMLARTEEELISLKIGTLKAELEKIMEDIGQEQLGLVRDDYAEKKARAAEIINELRVLEGKEPRAVK